MEFFLIDMFIAAAIFGFLYGFLLQKADFCFVASVRDFVSVRDSRLGKGVLILIATAMMGWGISLTFGWSTIGEVWSVPIGFTNLVGGLLFGIGMTIAGSCASGALYRAGMGYVQFWIVIISMMIGNILFALVYDPWTANYVQQPLQLAESGFSLFQLNLPFLLLPILIVGVMILITIRQFGVKGFFNGFKEAAMDLKGNPLKRSHWDIRLVAFLLGVIATVQFIIMSSISITGPETRMVGVALSFIFGEEFIYNNTYLNQMFASFPSIGIGPEETLIIFIVLGAFVASLLSGSFRLRLPKKKRLPYAIGGGLLMGISSRLAPGCNIANVVSGVGGLSISSIIVVIGMAVGVFIATAYIFKMPLLLFQKMDFEDDIAS
ncbi:YeeE/YedE family protein [Filobacillus milosensis]|uniref:YeeE/YedE family protein n=1 Tax=Filobacillus milosensis TaxID=94137 RepID=A0A4Y8ITE2_9BACI|nr:YeeE/YedE family protein [Filobacillus milosensis]TFB24057.1 YeeE/YedE family protein [Filobacillus milosensis]